MPPPARRPIVTGGTESATGGQASSRVLRRVEFGAVQESTMLEAPKTGEMENARSGSTNGPLRFVEKVDCGAALESKVVEEPKVDSELPDLRRSWRSRRWHAGRLTRELPHLPKVLEEPKVKKCRQWRCHVCGKHVSSSNRAKHMERIHPGFHTGRRGRPKVLRGGVDLD